MKRKLLIISLVLMLAAITAIAASADGVGKFEPADPQPVPEFGNELMNESTRLWFVEFPSKPTAVGGSKVLAARDNARFQLQAQRAGLDYDIRYTFSSLWNGLSIDMDPSQLATLGRIRGVSGYYPITTIEIPATSGSITPDLYTAIQMTGADIAQSELGFTGAGVKVAVMDTGIDYDHPDLGGCFGAGCRVETGWDFVGDDFNAEDEDPIIAPDDDPDDCEGHGTHVSGIVGANGEVTGVAPGVTFGAYRVFGCEGSTTSDIMIAAMEMALADGMDILNMSIGSSYTWPQYPTARASNNMVSQGMIVVASIGNSGASGTFSAGAPGLGKDVIGVASVDNLFSSLVSFDVDGRAIGYTTVEYTPLPPTMGAEEYVYLGLACNDYPLEGDPAGKVALVMRGDCSFRDKVQNSMDAGATAVVIHNNAPGVINATVSTPPLDIPAVFIDQSDGEYMRSFEEPASMTWTDVLIQAPNPTGGLISSFSSYGLAPDLTLKPDISAPGGNIYSTIPVEQGSYGVKGGTSMSSPHVAGAAALILEAHPRMHAREMRDILQNSADPFDIYLAPGSGLPEVVHRQGAGLVDIDDSILATTRVTPGKLSLGESEAGPVEVQLTVHNFSKEAVTYDLSHLPALTTAPDPDLAWADPSGTFFPSFWFSDAEVEFAEASVTVSPGRWAYVNATIYPATSPENGQYGGYIVLTPQGEGQTYRVPYAGFVGDYQGIDPLFNIFEMPWLIESADGDLVYSMEEDDIPVFWVHMDHQARKFRMEVFAAETGRFWGRPYNIDYMTRNSAYNSYFDFEWNGESATGKRAHKVPDGDFYVKISVLKALGDKENPDHWVEWTSPVFTIERSK